MEIKLNQDTQVTVYDDCEDSSEEFYPKGHIFDVDYVGMASSVGSAKFPQFQNGDGSVFTLPTEAFEVIETCDNYEVDLEEP